MVDVIIVCVLILIIGASCYSIIKRKKSGKSCSCGSLTCAGCDAAKKYDCGKREKND